MRVAILIISVLLSILTFIPKTKAQMRTDKAFSIEIALSDVDPDFLMALEDINDCSLIGKSHLNLKERLLMSVLNIAEKRKENTRLVASLLTLTLGPFGAHRLYLGTDAIVPIFYTATLGGGLGILPVIDLFHILLKKDLSGYYNNPSVFMWGSTKDDKNPETGQ